MNFDHEMKDRMRQNFIIVGIRSEPSTTSSAQEDQDPNDYFSDSSSLASSSYETAASHCTCSSEGRPCWRVQQQQELLDERKEDEEEEDKETEELRKKQEEEDNKITKQDIKIIKRKWKSVYYEVNLEDTNCLGTKKVG